MANLYELIAASAQLVKRIPIRSVKEIPLVIPVEYPAGNFNLDRKSAAMDGDVYRASYYETLANNSDFNLYMYSPTYPFIIELITFATTNDAEVETAAFEEDTLPTNAVEITDLLFNINKWKYPDANSYVEFGYIDGSITGDYISSWLAAQTPYKSANYICSPGIWYTFNFENIGSQTSNVFVDIYIQEQIQGHESAT